MPHLNNKQNENTNLYICISILYWCFSFWLTSLCIIGSSFIHLIRLKKKKKYKPNHQQTGIPPHSALPIREKTNKQKLSINLTLYKAHHKPLHQPYEGRNHRREERIQPSSRKEFNFPWSLGKGDLKHNNLKKKWKGRKILHKWKNKLETQKSI